MCSNKREGPHMGACGSLESDENKILVDLCFWGGLRALSVIFRTGEPVRLLVQSLRNRVWWGLVGACEGGLGFYYFLLRKL